MQLPRAGRKGRMWFLLLLGSEAGIRKEQPAQTFRFAEGLIDRGVLRQRIAFLFFSAQ